MPKIDNVPLQWVAEYSHMHVVWIRFLSILTLTNGVIFLKILFVLDASIILPVRSYGGTERLVWSVSSALSKIGQEISIIANTGSVSTFAEIVRVNDSGEIKEFLTSKGSDYDVICDCTHSGKIFQREELGRNFVNLVDIGELPEFQIEKPNILTVSHSFAARIRMDLGFDSRVIYPGLIDLENSPNPVTSWDQKDDRFIYVGRIIPEKGPLNAVRFSRRAGKPLDMIAGGGKASPSKSLFVSLGKRIAKLGAPSDKVARFFGQPGIGYVFQTIREHRGHGKYLENVPANVRDDLYSRSIALVFPVDWEEPGTITPIEAAALGTPTVAYSRGNLPEVIEDGVTGFLIRPGDERAFVEALNRVKTLNPNDCVRMAREKFSIERTAKSYLSLFEEVASGKKW